MSFAQECIEEAELRSLFASNKPSIVAYDGFEPSGRMHIAQVWGHTALPASHWLHAHVLLGRKHSILLTGLATYLLEGAGSCLLKRYVDGLPQGVMKALNVNKLLRCGVTFKFWCVRSLLLCIHAGGVSRLYEEGGQASARMHQLTGQAGSHRVADWFAQLNEKMGGDLKKIKVVGEYMIEIWKACGMEGIGDSSKVHDPPIAA